MSRAASTGIAIDGDVLRVVCVREDRVEWTLDAAVEPDASLGVTLAALMARAPAPARSRRVAAIAVGSSLVQVRRLEGFPAADGAALRQRLLAEGVRRWFLMRAGGLLAAGPYDVDDGAPWGAAFERSAIDELRGASEGIGLTVRQVAPTVAILGELSAGPRSAALAIVDTMLGSLGPEAAPFAGALAAAVLAARDELAPLALAGTPARDRAIPRTRSIAARVGLSIAALVLLLAYPLALQRERRRLTAELSFAEMRLSALAARSREFGLMGGALDAIASRRATRISWITPLAKLSDALPAGTAAVTVRADSTSAVIVIVGPRAGAVIDRLDGVAGIAAPELVGPVTTESIGGQLVERATIGFTLSSPQGGAR